jgi:hypothetical protein
MSRSRRSWVAPYPIKLGLAHQSDSGGVFERERGGCERAIARCVVEGRAVASFHPRIGGKNRVGMDEMENSPITLHLS